MDTEWTLRSESDREKVWVREVDDATEVFIEPLVPDASVTPPAPPLQLQAVVSMPRPPRVKPFLYGALGGAAAGALLYAATQLVR